MAAPRQSDWTGQPLRLWVRGTLVLVALALATVFALAAWINPYGRDGRPATMATHRQLGLPACDFLVLTGRPCPACGLTTSFAFTVRGDAINAARANWVGLLMAAFLMLAVPWAVASAVAGRALLVRNLEAALIGVLFTLYGLLIVRWAVVLWNLWRG